MSTVSEAQHCDVALRCMCVGFPSVEVPQTELVFEEGVRDGVLECRGSGDPTPDMQWLRLPEMTLLPSPGFPNYVC